MKRKIALLLSLILLLTMVFPLQGYAAGLDKELENAIRTAKVKFSIPDDYKFTSSMYTSQDKKIFDLNWTGEDTIDSVRINVSVDGDGNILNYYRYSPNDYILGGKLPLLSREEAKARADGYIERIAPDLLSELQYMYKYPDSLMDVNYYLSYYRVVNGVPYYNDAVYVSINRNTGELQSYSRNWTDILDFPQAEGAISPDEAEKAYMENLGLRLIYSYIYKDDMIRTFPLYTTVYENRDFVIDAFTGRKYRLNYNTGVTAAMPDASVSFQKEMVRMAAGEIVQLSPEELRAIDEAGELISLEEAEELARGTEYLGISDEYELQNYYLNTSWPDGREYLWSLDFSKPSEGNGSISDSVYVSINAKSKEITSFYFYNYLPDAGQKKPINDIADARAEADAFLRKYYPQYYKQVEYNEIYEEYLDDPTIKERTYTFEYMRIANDVPFPDNGLVIKYDNISGSISGFNLYWYDTEFPSIKNVISLEDAYEVLFDKIGLVMEYRYGSDIMIPFRTGEQQKDAKAALVYALAPNIPLYIDAISGNIVYKSGEEYVEPKKVSYTDIEGHFAEKEIKVLADFGIYLEGTEFRPNEAILQKEFLTLLSKSLNYYGPVITEKSTKAEIDEFYAYLVRDGIIKEAEIAPDSIVTREEAVKYIIRALKYDKVADIKGIFQVGFKDSGSISEDLYGYVAIASGLGIIKGDGSNFRPKKNTTRGEAAVMIYNYLRL